MNTKIKPCPRCGNPEGELEPVEGLWMALDGQAVVHVTCLNCGFTAMAGDGDEHAIKLWNEEPDLSGKALIYRDRTLSYLLGTVHSANVHSNLTENPGHGWAWRDPTILIRYKNEADEFVAEVYLKEDEDA